ncbi:class E sortase [Streptomyces sp. TRM76323]|uniref:Class E sortase n=1 Tax=Streptomyces tamarix TaxID=3078565 RepID=A0ABU3QGM5_9ACTN|nr:class E sortase [Streptomyces tamarix]MDT9681938.1 class E sortase [Streptomyces tamarix]
MTPVRPEHDATGSGPEGSPWFRATNQPPRQEEPVPGSVPEPQEWQQQPYAPPGGPPGTPGPAGTYEPPYEAYAAPEAYAGHGAYGAQGGPQDPYAVPQQYAEPRPPFDAVPPHQAPQPYGTSQAYARPQGYDEPGPYERPYAPRGAAGTPPAGADADATAVLPVTGPAARRTPGPAGDTAGDVAADPMAVPAPRGAGEPRTGGRAERRRAAKGRGGRRRAPGSPPPTAAPTGAPLSRVEARRAARAAKDGFGVIASRVMGEVFITFGVVMLLFVAYQLWWTNVQAGLEVDKAKDRIAQNWAKGDSDREPGVFEAGEGFAILHIPKLDVVVPVAEGIDKEKVLDKGMAGHYAEGALKTAMPSDKEGNFAVAGHRNTHGEPFRYINRLRPGDPIVVETREAYYIYEMASILPQTPPSNVSVLKPVPEGSGFTGPGRYITLTTCTPEFTSTYRMIVWGKMVEERPRSKGVPDALAG